MHKQLPLKTLIAAVALSALSGCATIVGEPEQTITFTTTPSKSGLVITDERGKEVFYGETPTTVTLQKSDGTYFGGKSYRIAFSKPGYDGHEITLQAKPNGWYIGGNIIAGGIIGWLVVDPWNGNMYTLGEEYVDTTLRSGTAMQGDDGVNTINIALYEDLTPEQKDKLAPVKS